MKGVYDFYDKVYKVGGGEIVCSPDQDSCVVQLVNLILDTGMSCHRTFTSAFLSSWRWSLSLSLLPLNHLDLLITVHQTCGHRYCLGKFSFFRYIPSSKSPKAGLSFGT